MAVGYGVASAATYLDKHSLRPTVQCLPTNSIFQGINSFFLSVDSTDTNSLDVAPSVPIQQYFINCYPPVQQASVVAQYAEQSVVVEGDEIAQIQAACRTSRVTISLGISERLPGSYALFNAQVHIDSDGSILGVHRKLQPTFAERFLWSQGDGSTLRTYPTRAGYNLAGLCCWEHTMNGARQALVEGHQHIHAGAWPSLSTIQGFEDVADLQTEALMKNHALTGQVFVISASNYVDETCLAWLRENLGDPGDLLKPGGGWSAIIHPFCSYLAGPITGEREELLQAEIDLGQLGAVKAWVDGAGHYSRPEIIQFHMDCTPYWENRRNGVRAPGGTGTGTKRVTHCNNTRGGEPDHDLDEDGAPSKLRTPSSSS